MLSPVTICFEHALMLKMYNKDIKCAVVLVYGVLQLRWRAFEPPRPDAHVQTVRHCCLARKGYRISLSLSCLALHAYYPDLLLTLYSIRPEEFLSGSPGSHISYRRLTAWSRLGCLSLSSNGRFYHRGGPGDSAAFALYFPPAYQTGRRRLRLDLAGQNER